MSAKPTFNLCELATRGYYDIPQSPRARIAVENVPGVNGDFVQVHGSGGREIEVHGQMAIQGNTADLAHSLCKLAIRSCQNLVGTTGIYVGCDGVGYSNCSLMSYTASRCTVVKDGQKFLGVCSIEAKVHQAGA